MNQVKVFISEDSLNRWLAANVTLDVVQIQYQYSHSSSRYMVWYKTPL